MARPRSPVWLAAPTRFATFQRPAARLALALLAILIVASLASVIVANRETPLPATGTAQGASDQPDIILYDSIVAGVRNGGQYYAVAAQALRTGNYPLRPFVAFRLPTLAVVQATLPPGAAPILLDVLAGLVALAWFVRLRSAFAGPPAFLVAMALLAAGMVAFVQPGIAGFHEVWAGLLLALSLAVRGRDRWVEAVAIAMIAMLIRETAALYVGVMAVLALAEGRRREAAGWAISLIIFAAVIVAHAHAVALVLLPTDPVSPGWLGLHGFGFFLQTMTAATALQVAPGWLAAMLTALSLFGWAAWNSDLALRALSVFTAYAALLALFGRIDTLYWGLMIAPAFLIGLAFVPDGLRELAVIALHRPRITVTRVTR